MAAQKPSRTEKHRILIVDDHAIVREGLALIINQQANLTVCGQVKDAHAALASVATLKPDLVLVDISLRGINGIELTKNIHRQYQDVAILVLSMHDESLYAERVLRAGARGYIMKQEGTDKVVAAIERVLGGEVYVSDSMAKRLLTTFHPPRATRGQSVEKLSDRELEVFRLIGHGYGTRQIADVLRVSVKTVDTYRQHIREKLNLDTASDVLQHAIQWVQSEQVG